MKKYLVLEAKIVQGIADAEGTMVFIPVSYTSVSISKTESFTTLVEKGYDLVALQDMDVPRSSRKRTIAVFSTELELEPAIKEIKE